jgi:hypothetical protein
VLAMVLYVTRYLYNLNEIILRASSVYILVSWINKYRVILNYFRGFRDIIYIYITSHYLPDINTVNTVILNKNFLSSTFIFRKQFYVFNSGLKIISHGNPDNNLESHCIFVKNFCLYSYTGN